MRVFCIYTLVLMVGLVTRVAGQSLPVNDKTGKVTFMDVVSADGLSSAELFKIGKAVGEASGWTVLEEEAGGKVKFQASKEISYASATSGNETGIVSYTYTFFAKEGKYRYIFTDFVHKQKGGRHNDGGKLENDGPDCGKMKMKGSSWAMIKTKTHRAVEASITDLKKKVKEVQNDPEKDDNW